MRKRTLSGLFAAVATATTLLVAAPAAQASTSGPTCGQAYRGVDNGQEYVHVQCSPGTAGWWGVAIWCSDGTEVSAGPFTAFRSVNLYCPLGTTFSYGLLSPS